MEVDQEISSGFQWLDGFFFQILQLYFVYICAIDPIIVSNSGLIDDLTTFGFVKNNFITMILGAPLDKTQ